MDGLSIRNSDALLRTGRTSSEIRNTELNKEAGATGDVQSFADTLKSAVNSVNELSQEANVQMQKLATGETKNIPEVMIASEKASVAFKLMLQVRNKVIDAYQEIMKMQV
ncbi:MAG: flagellar hook-basal body complex protein FliE [Bdellovibrionota bacterium]